MTQTATWTIEEYYKALEEGRLDDSLYYEILDGKLIVMSSPKFIHQWVLQTLFVLVRSFALDHKLGTAIIAPMDVILSNEQKPQPDLIFIAKEHLKIVKKFGYIRGTPDLLVEVLSPSTSDQDRNRKRRIYAEAGVREYWIIDTDQQTAQVLTLEKGRYKEVTQPAGRLVSGGVLAGFSIEISELFNFPVGIDETEQAEETGEIEE